MKQSYTYSIVFTLIVSAVFTLVLATTANVLKPRIEANQELAEQSALLYTFDLPSEGSPEEVEANFQKYIQEQATENFTYFQAVNDEGEVVAYALPFEGSGLWGAIHGWLGVDESLEQVTGIVFTDQNETPGLGGQIDEEWFKEQFRGLVIDPATPVRYGPSGDTSIDAISGATQTSNAVISIVNKVVQETLVELEGVLNG